jgi:hypothetical protein
MPAPPPRPAEHSSRPSSRGKRWRA